MVCFGTVIDENLKDELRVTMIATGLRGAVQPLSVIEATGTNNPSPMQLSEADFPTDDPAVLRPRESSMAIEALEKSGYGKLDIPTFLRRQAD